MKKNNLNVCFLSVLQGRPPGFVGFWPSRAITFIDNHDTGSTLNHWPFPANHIQEGYAYILTHPGTPCVFLDHLMQEQGGLRKVSLQESWASYACGHGHASENGHCFYIACLAQASARFAEHCVAVSLKCVMLGAS
jgi:hypothetical protein